MKTVKIMLPLLAALMFGNGVVRAQNEAKHDKPAVEVVVFHGVKQCQTCQAIKKIRRRWRRNLPPTGRTSLTGSWIFETRRQGRSQEI